MSPGTSVPCIRAVASTGRSMITSSSSSDSLPSGKPGERASGDEVREPARSGKRALEPAGLRQLGLVVAHRCSAAVRSRQYTLFAESESQPRSCARIDLRSSSRAARGRPLVSAKNPAV